MAARGLLFDLAPPLSVPLRFLLTAPWFAVLAAALLAWAGPDAVASRWTPALLGATHLLTLGFMAMTMLGALFQILPVVGGAPLPAARTVASIVHPTLALGALALTIGMTLGMQWAIRAALALLATAFIAFLVPAARCLLRGDLRDSALRTIGLALLGLLVAISLGATMATAFGWTFALPLIPLTALHAAWGLLGWTVLLVAGVAQHVVPMFQATAPYPRWFGRAFAPALVALLLAWSVASWFGMEFLSASLTWPILAATASFAVVTLWLQRHARRQRRDPTAWFWSLGMLSLLAAPIASGGAQLWGWPETAGLPLAIGTLTIVGFALSVISGMLYKIVPFLLWLELQRDLRGRPPHIKQIMPDRYARLQLRLHAAATFTLLSAAVGHEVWFYPGAGLLAASALTLGVGLLRASWFAHRSLHGSESLPRPIGGSRRGWREL
jgi:hypothetical protein